MSTAILDEQKLNKPAVWTLSAAHLFNDLMTTGIVPALLPLYKIVFHLSYTSAGLIVLASYMTSSIMQPLFGVMTDAKPRIWVLPAGVLLVGTGLALTGAVPTLPWLLLAIALSGLGSGAFHPEASRGAHLAAGRGKGMAQAIFQVGGNFGQALGPLIVSLFLLPAHIQKLLWFIPIAVVMTLIIARLMPWYGRRVAEEGQRHKTVVGKNRPWGLTLLVIIVIFRSWAQIGVAAFLPFYYEREHIPLSKGEMFTFLFLAAGALATFIGGILSDRLGRKNVMTLSMGLAIPFAFVLPHATGAWSYIVLIAFGFTILSSFAVTVVYGQMLLPRRIGMASGLIIGLGVGAGGIGATGLGWLADHYGIPLLFSLIGFLPLLSFLLSLGLPSDRTLQSGVK